MSQTPPLPTTFDGWVQLFAAGRRMTVPVTPSLLRRRIRGNRQVTALVVTGLALVVAVIIWLATTEAGRTFTYVITGAVALLLGFVLVHLRRLRGRLAVAEIDPNYLDFDKDGFVVAGTLKVPWERTVGVVSLDLRKQSDQGPRRLGARLARTAGATQADVVIGLAKGTAKPLKADADARLRQLIDAFSDRGSVRIPLDAVLHPSHVTSVLFAMCGAANVAGRESVLASETPKIRAALNKAMRSEPPINGLSIMDEMAAGESEQQGDAAPPPASPSSALPPSGGPTIRTGSASPPPPPSGPPVPPTPSEPPTIEDLATLVLSQEGRRERAEARAFLAANGAEAFAGRYPQYDDGFSDDGPDPLVLLLAVGVELSSIGTCDARHEDSPGHVRHYVTLACERLGLPTPSFEGIHVDDGKYPVVARMQEADEALRRVGLRLLFVDPDSDMYYFSPVPQEQFTKFAGTSGAGFDLRGIDWIS